MVELARDVVRNFNELYHKEVLVLPEVIQPSLGARLPGIDGQKMSKSQGNAIYLSDENDEIAKKIMKMKSDPNRKSLSDPGDPKEAACFSYLEIFHSDQKRVEELKEHYRRGGLPDKVLKEETAQVLISFITPIRERRKEFSDHPDIVYEVIRKGTQAAQIKAAKTLAQVKEAMGIKYRFMI